MTVLVNNPAAGLVASAYGAMNSVPTSPKTTLAYTEDLLPIPVPFNSAGPSNAAGVTSTPATGTFTVATAGTYQFSFAANIYMYNADQGDKPASYTFYVYDVVKAEPVANSYSTISNVPITDTSAVAAMSFILSATAGDSFQLRSTTTNLGVVTPLVNSLNFTCTKVA